MEMMIRQRTSWDKTAAAVMATYNLDMKAILVLSDRYVPVSDDGETFTWEIMGTVSFSPLRVDTPYTQVPVKFKARYWFAYGGLVEREDLSVSRENMFFEAYVRHVLDQESKNIATWALKKWSQDR